MDQQPRTAPLRTLLAGTMLTIYGALGAFSWSEGVPLPLFVPERGAPISFTAALGLACGGLALVALARGRRRVAVVLAGGLLAVVAAGVVGFRIPPDPGLRLAPGETGRMSWLASLALSAFALGVLFQALRPARPLWTAALATMALTPALLSLLGEVVSRAVQFEWVRKAGMANAASFGLLFGAAALWELVWRQTQKRQRPEMVSLSLFSLAAVAGLGAGLIAWQSNQLQIVAIERGEHSRKTSGSLNYVELLLTRMESTARGYALGREEWLLAGYQEFAGLLDGELVRLRRLMAGEASRRRGMAALDDLVRQKRAYMDGVIAGIRSGETSTHPTEFRAARGPELTNAIRRLINELDADAISTATRLSSEAAKAGAQTSAVILLAAVLGSACIVAGAIATGRARVDRDAAEEKLAANESRLRKAQQMARMGSWEFAVADRASEWWSEEAFRLFGLAPEERTVSGREYFDRVFPADVAGVRQTLDEVIARGRPAHTVYRIVRPDGEVRWLHDDIEPVLDGRGAVVRVRGVMQDITEEKRAQLELAAIARLQRAVIEGTVVGIISTQPDGVIATFNRGAEKMLGYTREEMIGRQTPAAFHDAAEIVERAAELNVELAGPVEPGFDVFVALSRVHGVEERKWTYVRKDGSRFPVWLSVTTLRDDEGAIAGYLGIATDVTERERSAELLRRSRERLETIFVATEEGLVLQTHNGAVLECNDAACRILGLTREQLTGRDSLDPRWGTIREDGTPFPGEEHPAPLALRTRQTQRDVVQGIRRADGRIVWIRVTSVPILEPDGSVRQVVSSFTEITAQLALEAELRDSGHRLRLAADVAGIGVWYWDVGAGDVSVWDEHVFGIFGMKPTPGGRVTHTEWAALLLPEELAPQEASLRATLETGATQRREYRIRRADTGELRVIESAHAAVRDRSGRVGRVVGVNRDVTDERQTAEVLRASEERFRALALRAPVGIFQTDAQGACLYVNERWCEIAGLKPEQALGEGWMVALHPEDAGKVAEWWRDFAASGREFNHDYRFCRPDGEVAWVSGQAVWLKDRHGRFTGCIGTVTDITERRELLRRLERTRDEALEASRLKSEFLANMSHEIRTPMNGIIGMTNLLLETTLAPDQREMTQVVQSSADNLLTIINDILDFSRIEAGKLRLETREFNLRVVVEETITLLNASAQVKRLEMLFEWDPLLECDFRGDAVRIRQVLTNLIGNAVKFTDRGRVKVAVRRRHDARDRVGVRVEVIDTGCGIAPADQAKLFDAFVQVDGSSTRRHGGTGLGLAISRQLVELMGGTIGLESEAGRGSKFWFELELQKPPNGSTPPLPRPATARRAGDAASAGPAAPRPAPPPPSRRLHLLLAEDNHSNQLVARNVLERMGHSVAIAANGAEALEWLAQESFDAVLMDCQMPVMDGYTATERIRRGAVAGLDVRIPIIALTAYALPSDRLKCISAGMDEYIAKPLRVEDLEAAFRHCGLLDAAGRPAGAAGASEAAAESIDLDHLRRLSELPGRTGATLLEDMVAIFEAETKNTLPLVAALEASRSDSELALLAHRLSGGAANLGARSLRAIGLRLEAAARDGDWAAVAPLRREFEEEWARLRAALRKDFT